MSAVPRARARVRAREGERFVLDDDREPGQRGLGPDPVLAAQEDLEAALDGVVGVVGGSAVAAGDGEQLGAVLAGDPLRVDGLRGAARGEAGRGRGSCGSSLEMGAEAARAGPPPLGWSGGGAGSVPGR
jgi:hypothetical protein